MVPCVVSRTACLLRISDGGIVDVKKGSRVGAGRAGRVAWPAATIKTRSNSIAEIICYILGRLSVAVGTTSREGIQYEEFYGFVQSPFTLAPDPRFLYPSPSHDEALHLLLNAINRKEGIV